MGWKNAITERSKAPKKYKYLTISFGKDVGHLRDWVKAKAESMSRPGDKVYESDIVKALIQSAMEEENV